MTETRRLLREYVEEGSESAFRELVERYIDLVYSTALRLVAGDAHRAEDVAQTVFVRLTHKAKTLDEEVSLGGWLHRDTCHVAATLMRGERRRQIREREAVEMNAINDETDSNLANVLPILDEAIDELGNEDREAIMLRFFEQQSFRAVGEMVGSSEDAARMRVNRALEKLHGLLSARGVGAVSVGALTTILGAKAVSAAPVGLAATVVKGLGASVLGGGASSPAAVRPLAKSLKLALVPGAALVLILSVGIYLGHRAAEKAVKNPVQNIAAAPATSAAIAAATVGQERSPTPTTNSAAGFMMFHTIDAASGIPLSGTKILVAYSSSSPTNSNVVNLETDSKGVARIGLPQPPFMGVSIQVTSAGHVPVVSSFSEGEQMPTNYVVKLAAGGVVGGIVLDEEQQPVAGAKIELSGPRGFDITKRENIAFGRDTWLYTDANGKWWSDMVPADYDSISVTVKHPDFAITTTNVPANTPDATGAVLRLRKGVMITGSVLDLSGQPIAGASIREVNNRSDNPFFTNSDENGGFVFTHRNPGGLELSVQANGFGPTVLDTVVSNSPVTLNFKLGPGHTLRGSVVDESGNPVTNATVSASNDVQGEQKFNWSAKTDAQGRFEWNSAPTDSLSYFVVADGFDYGVEWLQADNTEHEIKLIRSPGPANPNIRIRGIATDADTGQPLDEFKVLVGRVQGPRVQAAPEFAFETDGRDGQFDFRKNMQYGGPTYLIQIQKDGYAPAVSTNLLVQNGDSILMFGLHKDAGFSGELILPDGNPVANATVFLTHAQGGVYLDGPGKVQKEVSTHLHTQVDDRGHFSFASVLNARDFIVIGQEGFAEVPIGGFSGKIVLQPWGRIEGKLLMGGRPGAGQTIWLSDVVYQELSSSQSPPLSVSMETTTSDDGSFVFEKVPPGERHISQRLMAPNGGLGRIYQAQEKTISVAPGVVTHVELGGSGRIVTGRASLEGKSVKWREVAAELRLKLPGGPGEMPKPEDFPSTEAFRTATQTFRKAQLEFRASEKGHELERARRSYSAYCFEDGSFSIPDVPHGQYDLEIDVRDRAAADAISIDVKQVGVLEREIDVPESEDGKEHEVLDLGAMEVPPVKANQGGSVQFMYAR